MCVHSSCGSNPDLGGVGSISNICISFPQLCKSICEKTLSQISQMASFPLFPNSSCDIDISQRGKEAASDCLDQSVHVSANSIRNVLWPLTLPPHPHPTPSFVSPPHGFADAMLTSPENVGLKHFFKLNLIFIFLFERKSSHLNHQSELFSCALIIISPLWLPFWRAAVILLQIVSLIACSVFFSLTCAH